MRLLERRENGDLSLTKNFTKDVPHYAILSHTWGDEDEEVTFKDLTEGSGKSKAGYQKIRFCGDQAFREGLRYFWVDTCCIDRSDIIEFSRAINSMFRWYAKATECYVHLLDVSANEQNLDEEQRQSWEPAFRKSKWFTRGWTLQELIAPKSVKFFSREGRLLGDKISLERLVCEITGIATSALQGKPPAEFSITERFLWAKSRNTKYEEDEAYSLLGIFNVNLPLIYGEGKSNALRRLREEVDIRFGYSKPSAEGKPKLPVPFARDNGNITLEVVPLTTVTGVYYNTLTGHIDVVYDVAFSPNGKLIASASRDGTVKLWNTESGTLYNTIEGNNGHIYTVAFSPDSKLVAFAGWGGEIKLWDVVPGVERNTSMGHVAISSIAFHPDSNHLASGFFDMSIRLWDINSGAELKRFKGHTKGVTGVAFSPDGELIASVSGDETVRLWNTTAGTAHRILIGHTMTCISVAFSPSGNLVASGSNDMTIKLWDAATGVLRTTLKGHTNPVRGVSFSPSGNLIASGSLDKTVRLWDTVTGALLNTLEGHTDSVTSVSFSPSGNVIASCSIDQTIKLWEIKTT